MEQVTKELVILMMMLCILIFVVQDALRKGGKKGLIKPRKQLKIGQ